MSDESKKETNELSDDQLGEVAGGFAKVISNEGNLRGVVVVTGEEDNLKKS